MNRINIISASCLTDQHIIAEMKLAGEGWLEFKIHDNKLIQTTTLRSKGVLVRLYLYLFLPFHSYLFNGTTLNLTK